MQSPANMLRLRRISPQMGFRMLVIGYLVYLLVKYFNPGHISAPETVVGDLGFLFNPSGIKFVPLEVIDALAKEDQVAWDRTAYVQYATSMHHFCAALINLAKMRSGGTQAHNLVILYDLEFDRVKAYTDEMKHYADVAYEFRIRLQPVQVSSRLGSDDTHRLLFTKFEVFRLTEFDRVVYFDSDMRLMAPNLDELFALPDVDVAMPQAYWIADAKFKEYRSKHKLKNGVPTKSWDERREWISAALQLPHLYELLPVIRHQSTFTWSPSVMVIKPSQEVYDRLRAKIKWRGKSDYDLELINQEFSPFELLKPAGTRRYTALVLPHQLYGGLLEELRHHYHAVYAADAHDLPLALLDYEDAQTLYWGQTNLLWITDSLRLVHYKDKAIPEPWIIHHYGNKFVENRIVCFEDVEADTKEHRWDQFRPHVVDDCVALRYWTKLYDLHQQDRGLVCHLNMMILPLDIPEEPPKNMPLVELPNP